MLLYKHNRCIDYMMNEQIEIRVIPVALLSWMRTFSHNWMIYLVYGKLSTKDSQDITPQGHQSYEKQGKIEKLSQTKD